MKKTIMPSSATVTTQPDGGACVLLGTPGGKDDLEVRLSPELWRRLGDDARWHATQANGHAVPVGEGVLKRFEALAALGLDERVKAVEERLGYLERTRWTKK